MNETRFLDFIDKKWSKDYEILEKAIGLSVQKLSQTLKHTINASNYN